MSLSVQQTTSQFPQQDIFLMRTRARFATSNTFGRQFYGYLLPNGYVQRVSRGIYEITPKGQKLLEILN